MRSQLLPRQVDNTYRGYRLGIWLFVLLVVIKVAMGLNSMFNGYSVASSADGIPLDTFTPDAAQTVVALFAIWGLSHVVFAILCLVVLGRYRSLIPLMFALLLVEQVSRRLILLFLPIARSGTPPGFFVNVVLLAVTVVGLGLSLRRPSTLSAGE
jgi:hypothetical protein